jgi:hypothetical protein
MARRSTSKSLKSSKVLQDRFFAQVKRSLPSSLGLAEEVSELLNISLDGAYRRIRGETDLTIDEISRITSRYFVSIDELLGHLGDIASFTYTKLTDSEVNFVSYLTRLHSQLKFLNSFPNRKIFYVADEAPIFYAFGSRKLAEFKLFFWQRSVLNIAKYQQEKFRWGLIPKELLELATDSFSEYMNIPSTEVWTDETVLTNIKQIRFYFDSGLLQKEDALLLLSEHKNLIQRMYQMAENGRKNVSDKDDTLVMYCSDVVLGTNCIYALMGDLRYSYVTFNSVNSLATNNKEFCEETENWLKNLERKSTIISGINEKQRFQFFNKMFRKIDDCIAMVEGSSVPG